MQYFPISLQYNRYPLKTLYLYIIGKYSNFLLGNDKYIKKKSHDKIESLDIVFLMMTASSQSQILSFKTSQREIMPYFNMNKQSITLILCQ